MADPCCAFAAAELVQAEAQLSGGLQDIQSGPSVLRGAQLSGAQAGAATPSQLLGSPRGLPDSQPQQSVPLAGEPRSGFDRQCLCNLYLWQILEWTAIRHERWCCTKCSSLNLAACIHLDPSSCPAPATLDLWQVSPEWLR